MPHTKRTWQKHPGRNPAHVFGGYVRPYHNAFGTIIGWRPRNPSRWLPHVGGAAAEVSTFRHGVVDPMPSRQQRRRRDLEVKKALLAAGRRDLRKIAAAARRDARRILRGLKTREA